MNINYTQAGAGSGKTYRIETDVASRLIDASLTPADLMVATFTNKAADELVNRISAQVLKAGHTGIAADLFSARIGTVHSVCGGLLADFCFELGLSPQQRVIDENDQYLLLNEALDRSIPTGSTEHLNQLADRLVVESWAGQVLKVIEQARLNDLSSKQLAQFSNKSITSLFSQLPDEDSSISINGLRAALASALASARCWDSPTQGLQTSIAKMDQILKQRVLTWEDWVRISKLKAGKAESPLLHEVKEYGSMVLKCPGFRADMAEFIERIFEAADDTIVEFSRIKAERGLLDFIDQEKLVYEALENPTIRQRLESQIKYLVVDEFQDTSPIQLALFSKLSQLADEVLLVGDAKQSIYGFRGAAPELALNVVKYVEANGGNMQILGDSWRSRAGLVELSNTLFTPAFAHILKPEQVRLNPRQSYTLPSAELGWWKLDGRNQALRLGALASGVREMHDGKMQVYDKKKQSSRDIQWRDIAILCRSNTDIQKLAGLCVRHRIPVAVSRSGLLETPEIALTLACLRRLADPSDSLASADIISFQDGTNAESWLPGRLEAVNAGEGKIWDRTASPILERLEQARSEIGVLSPMEALSLAIQVADVHQIILGWNEVSRLAEHRLANLQQLKKLSEDYESHCRANHLAGTITGFILWLHSLEQRFADEQAANPGNAVTISTYHGAKGLEWPVVICTSLNSSLKVSLSGIQVLDSPNAFDWNNPLSGRELRYWPDPFPSQKQVDPLTECLKRSPEWQQAEQRERHEAIQLLYVGMTRARDHLVLTSEGKSDVGAWLGLLDESKVFPIDDGSTLLPGGAMIDCVRNQLSDPGPVSSHSSLRARHWLPVPAGKSPSQLPYRRPPSSEKTSPGASASILHDFGSRLAISGKPDMDQLGNALHHCLALVLSKPDIKAEAIAQLLKQYPTVTLVADEIVERGKALLAWINTRYPGATLHTELPFSNRLSNGQLQSGRVDLALEMENGWIVIDHKSNPQPKSVWLEKAVEYQGQLDAYNGAISGLSGKPVTQNLIHFSVSGGIVEVTNS